MFDGWTADGKLRARLEEMDLQIAAEVRAQRCRHCGGRLDRADYPRKPRGGLIAAEGESWSRRISFCCGREGCRKRATPPSVRFLGRKVYVAMVVVVASVMACIPGHDGGGAADDPGVPKRTVNRWLGWWQTVFIATTFFVSEVPSRLIPPIETTRLPVSLQERFVTGDRDERLGSLLRFVSPVTTRSVGKGGWMARADA